MVLRGLPSPVRACSLHLPGRWESTWLSRLPQVALPPDELRTGQRQRILIVDDNEDAASMLSEYLQVLGHETRVCLDGPSALAVVAGFEPDIGLVDLGLPLMDGFELAQRTED